MRNFIGCIIVSFLIIKPISAEQKFHSLEELGAKYEAFLLDAYGVFWGSSEIGVLPGAAAAMEYLVSQGKYVGILSNSTILAAKEKEKLEKHGLYEGVHYHFLLTSGEVAKRILLEGGLPFPTPRNTFYLFSPPHPRFSTQLQIFEGTKYLQTEDLEEADFIYISIPHIDGRDQKHPEVFSDRVKALGTTRPLFCANPDRFAAEGVPARLVVRQGSIADLFKEEGADVYRIGKPSALVYQAALEEIPTHISKDKILMIGDTPETDIRGAHAVQLDAALVTKTGVLAIRFDEEGVQTILEELPSTDRPDYIIERLYRE